MRKNMNLPIYLFIFGVHRNAVRNLDYILWMIGW